MNSADLCRQNNWTVGTILEGIDTWEDPIRIVITAIGEKLILAKHVGDDGGTTEHLWELFFRNWKEVIE